ncbi:MAG: signal recognition particle-docking protein FtsY [Candidatus Diapherotrites archaeon]|uniref:Signal recognition particle-docking protein FtsY n=1 Tax=Candidatus Iainarchaeum sp. TaxID=3101447 RepID=A0A939C707_9ARCH|nr:signal recognition particle-docking protein FtsY [Candidatus Diapherotrites archaeon]
MFDLLKKKIQGFTEKVKERAEKKTETASQEGTEKTGPEHPETKEPEQAREQRVKKTAEKFPEQFEKPEAVGEEPEIEEEPPEQEEPEQAEEETKPGQAVEEFAEKEEPAKEAPAYAEERREIKPRVSIRGRIKAVVKGSVRLEEKDLAELVWELELALLEADVEQTTSEEIASEIKKRLVGKEIPRGKNLAEVVKKEIREILSGMMETTERNLAKEAKGKKEKPYKILFLGPNGAGKTTTIAKLTHLLQAKGMRVLWAAGDTFRAASIEQLEKHASRLGVRVVKHQYGADPAAVAFDAVKAAQSKGIECVLIDSAGRQETNKNLMRELEKIVRVIKPDLKIYVGEAFTGQALLQQAKEYDKEIGIDAFILTKIDCDSKGGTTISLLYKLKKPILFVGMGQEYKDLKEFKPEFILNRVIG